MTQHCEYVELDFDELSLGEQLLNIKHLKTFSLKLIVFQSIDNLHGVFLGCSIFPTKQRTRAGFPLENKRSSDLFGMITLCDISFPFISFWFLFVLSSVIFEEAYEQG